MQEKSTKLYSLQEVAQMLSVSVMTLRRWEKSGVFKAIRVGAGKLVRVPAEEVNRLAMTMKFEEKR